MVMYKLNNSVLEALDTSVTKYIHYNSRIYANPTENQLRAAGYKTLVRADPIDVPEGYYTVSTYTEDDTNIYESLSLKEFEEYDDPVQTEPVQDDSSAENTEISEDTVDNTESSDNTEEETTEDTNDNTDGIDTEDTE